MVCLLLAGATLLFRESCPAQLPVINEFGAILDGEKVRPGNLLRLYWDVEGADEVSISGVGQVSPTDNGEAETTLPAGAAAGFSPVLVPQGSIWKFHDEGVDLGTAWRFEGYDDDAWGEGPSELGFGDASNVTQLTNRMQMSVYFRHTFEVDRLEADAPLSLRMKRDDGVIIYLNGVELVRNNMHPGEVHFGMPASNLANMITEAEWGPVTLPLAGEILKEGTNTLAASVHQLHPNSSDIRFDFDLNYVGDLQPYHNYILTARNGSGTVTTTLSVPVELRGGRGLRPRRPPRRVGATKLRAPAALRC